VNSSPILAVGETQITTCTLANESSDNRDIDEMVDTTLQIQAPVISATNSGN
jgi:hypothetical protein